MSEEKQTEPERPISAGLQLSEPTTIRFSLKYLFLVTALFSTCAFLFQLLLKKPPRGPLGPMVSQVEGLGLLRQFATPVRWTHMSPVEDGGSTIYRFEDDRGQILVVLWDDGFSNANHIHLAVMRENCKDNPYGGPDSMPFDGENDSGIATELNRTLSSALSEPMPQDQLNMRDDGDFQQILKHLIQRVNITDNAQLE
jgi:hypothetical protein